MKCQAYNEQELTEFILDSAWQRFLNKTECGSKVEFLRNSYGQIFYLFTLKANLIFQSIFLLLYKIYLELISQFAVAK